MDEIRPDRLRKLLDVILTVLDQGLDGSAVAGRAFLSRFHFDRLVASGLGEAPGVFRRRLLLERSAWRLSLGSSVTDAGIEAGYGSTEAFSRAFSRSYGVPPGQFGEAPRDFRLVAPNGVHFPAPDSLWLTSRPAAMGARGDEKGSAMDLTDRLIEHDHWLTARLLEHATLLTDAQLDAEIRPGHVVLTFDGPEETVRAMLSRLVWTKEVWIAAIEGDDFPDDSDRSIAGLRDRWETAGSRWLALVRRIRERNEWQDAFVDALCDPPQSLSLGGVVAHVVTYSAHHRLVLAAALSELGVSGIEPAVRWSGSACAPLDVPIPRPTSAVQPVPIAGDRHADTRNRSHVLVAGDAGPRRRHFDRADTA